MLLTYILLFVEYIYIIYANKKSLHMLQQNLYNENNRYLKWIFKNKKQAFLNLNLYGVVFAVLLLLSMMEELDIFFIIMMMLVYVVSFFVDREKRKHEQTKKPLVITKRVKRLIVTLAILYLIPSVLIVINNQFRDVCLIVLAAMTSLNFIVVYIANLINHPIERMIFHGFERKAKKKLKSMTNLKVVGITGSYGKTSSKNILNDILNVKYNSLATPKSINTFNGLMIVINNTLTKLEDVFIAEMGAYVKGEIKGLCKLVGPKYGIITKIGTAHLATFGSEQNILDAKMELIESLPEDGVGVLNKDDEKQRGYKIKNSNPCRIMWIGIDSDDVDVKASNIKCSGKGTSFDITFKGDKKKYPFETKLLGRHNVYNILAAVALGQEFGLTIKELQQGVKRVQPVEHRLELKRLGNFYQIDDAYNSNPIGAKNALEVLDMMDGTKVVVTPGMIELGEKEDELNKEFGKQIADVADFVILVGEKKTKPIKEGLLEKKFKESKLYVTNDVKEAFTLINKLKSKEDIFALFENDLPDTYNE